MKLQATQIMIAFQVEGDRESDLVSLLQTILLMLAMLWGFWQWVNRAKRQLKGFSQDCQQAASFTIKVLTIGFSSLAFGVGVRL